MRALLARSVDGAGAGLVRLPPGRGKERGDGISRWARGDHHGRGARTRTGARAAASPRREPRSSSTTAAATNDGAGVDDSPAHEVVAEIRDRGGEAVANGDDVADWEGAQRLINSAIEAFGELDILVNNAGILRDRVLVNMSEAEWDDVIARPPQGALRADPLGGRVLARGAQGRARQAAQHRPHVEHVGPVRQPRAEQLRRGQDGHRHVQPDPRQGARPLRRQEQLHRPGGAHPTDAGDPGPRRDHGAPRRATFDDWDPANVSPLVAYLSTAGCAFNGETFFVQGGVVKRVKSWEMAETIERKETWTVEALAEALTAAVPS